MQRDTIQKKLFPVICSYIQISSKLLLHLQRTWQIMHSVFFFFFSLWSKGHFHDPNITSLIRETISLPQVLSRVTIIIWCFTLESTTFGSSPSVYLSRLVFKAPICSRGNTQDFTERSVKMLSSVFDVLDHGWFCEKSHFLGKAAVAGWGYSLPVPQQQDQPSSDTTSPSSPPPSLPCKL